MIGRPAMDARGSRRVPVRGERREEGAAMTWWAALYDDLLAEALLDRKSEDETRATLGFLEDRPAPRPGDVVFR